MKVLNKFWIFGLVAMFAWPYASSCQTQDTVWTLQECIEYALKQNISVQKSVLSNETNLVNLNQSKAARFPSLNASVSQNFSWSKDLNSNGGYDSNYTGTNGTSYGVNSSVTLYNGLKKQNTIKQQKLNVQAGQYDIETIKETVSLNILNAYLQVLYSEEQVKNTEKQIESTKGELQLAEERLRLGAISKSDYLQVKSELASENLTLANAQSLLTTNKVNLMQLMELHVTSQFYIEHPNFDNVVYQSRIANSDSVYQTAVAIKPQIKSAEIDNKIADIDVAVAKASYQPVLSLNGGVSSGYSSVNSMAYDYQVENRINPSVGLSLSIPIFQNKQARSSVAIAKINSKNAELNLINTKNQLRKEVEQASVDVFSAEKKYEASLEQYNASSESNNVAAEKYSQGLLNSVDFLIQKTNLINAESQFLQAKYNLVFSYKILDFYLGKSLTL
jgi:outer membrane protein